MITKEQFAKEVAHDMRDYLLAEGVNEASDPENYFPVYEEDAWDHFECHAEERDIKDALSGKYESSDIFTSVLIKAGWELILKPDFERKFGYAWR